MDRLDPCHDCNLDNVGWQVGRKGIQNHDDGIASCRFPCRKSCDHLDCAEARGGESALLKTATKIGVTVIDESGDALNQVKTLTTTMEIQDMATNKLTATQRKALAKKSAQKRKTKAEKALVAKKTAAAKAKAAKAKAAKTKATKATAKKGKPTTKVCSICEKRKKVDQFGVYTRSADRLRGYCRPCLAERRAAR